MDPPEEPWQDFRMRIAVTLKWGRYSFYSSIVVTTLWVFSLKYLEPYFQRKINEGRPVLAVSRQIMNLPWFKYFMWFWMLILTFMCIVESHLDCLNLAKRTGRLSTALMPPMYLFALRPSPLPETLYLAILPIHKWLARFIILAVIVHTILFTYFLVKINLLHFLFIYMENFFGIIALVLFIVTGYTAFKFYRRRDYQTFYVVHIVTVWVTLPLMYYHSRPSSNNYMLTCLILMFYQIGYRIYRSKTTLLRVQTISSSLVIVDIPKSDLPSWAQSWEPGSHCRLNDSLWNPMTWLLPSHPYSIASLDQDPTLRLVIRQMKYKYRMRKKYVLYGTFRAFPTYLKTDVHNSKIKRVLLVVGGSGIAFGAPMLRHFMLYGVKVRMMWAIRDPHDVRILPGIGLHQAALNGDLEIYYTGSNPYAHDEEDVEVETDSFDFFCSNTYTSRTTHGSHTPPTSQAHFASVSTTAYLNVPQSCTPPDIHEHFTNTLGKPASVTTPLGSHTYSHLSGKFQNYRIANEEPEPQPPIVLPTKSEIEVSRRARRIVRRDKFLSQYSHNMYNSRPVLNARVRMWLYGIETLPNDCCCTDHAIKVTEEQKKGVWVMATGVPKMVEDTKNWAEMAGVNFFEDANTL